MPTSRRALAALLLLTVAGSSLVAQRTPAPPASLPLATPYVTPSAGGKKALNIPDYARWRSVGAVAISDDGNWATWSYTQRNTDDTLFVKNLSTGNETRVTRGSGPQFSEDSRWLAYIVAPPGANSGRGGRGAAGGGGGAGGAGGRGGRGNATAPQAAGAAETPPAVRRLELRNLATGTLKTWDNPQSFTFNKTGTALMIRKPRPAAAGVPDAAPAGGGGRGGRGGGGGAGAPATVGTDMIVHHLKDGQDELIGSVSAAEFNRTGVHMAYTVASTDRDGNGLYVMSTETWTRRALDNARADYTRITWDSAGTAIAVMRGMEKRGFSEKENAVLAFVGVDKAEPTVYVVGPTVQGLSDKMVISDRGTLTWSPDLSKIFVALREQEASTPATVRRDSSSTEETPVGNVDVFHWKDPFIQTVQMSRAAQDRNRTFSAAVLLKEKKVVPLADERMSTVQIARDGNFGIGRDEKDYIHDWKPPQSDFYRVSTTTGERTPVLKAHERAMGLSADGKYWLYWKEKNVWAYNIHANTHANITRTAPVSFVNEEEDHVGDKPAYGVTGYSKDGKWVVLDHKYDLWLVSLDGSAPAKNLTTGYGTKNSIRLRYERIEAPDDATAPAPGGGGGRGGGGGGAVIDLSKPVSLSGFGELDKKDGFFEVRGDSVVKVLYDDKSFGRAIKAKNADKLLITRETYAEFPDVWVSDSKFAKWDRLTNANPQQSEYLWGTRKLFDYKDKDGHKLHGTLIVPDNYQPGQKLPMLVNFYEKNSQNLNRYSAPRFATAPQFADYVSNGYLVMQPDVYYHTGRSHTDMLNSVEAAVKKVIEMGYVDPKRVGLHGHSYSGQGAAFISTASTMFAAVIAGAAATDLVADFNQLWKSSGTNQHRYDIYGQGRFGTDPYTDLALYQDQSPVYRARTMNTHLLQVHGTNDGSVEWLQAIEFYNALRFLGKSSILLSYEGEAHGFTRYDNQYDVMVRMHNFFDHHLKGEPAAEWIANGIPFLKKKPPTGAAAQPVQLMGGGAGIGTPGTAGAAAGGGGRGGQH